MNIKEQYLKYLEQAKKRNHKIEINEVAISKVPRTKIYNLSNEDNARIQNYHKELLKRSMLQNNSNEMAVVINIRDDKSDAIWLKGTESEVRFEGTPAEYKIRYSAARQLMILHNHPCTQGYSYSDIMMLVNNMSLYGMTIVTNTGETHILVKTEMFDYRIFRQFVEMIKQKAMEMYSGIIDNEHKLTVVQEVVAKNIIKYADQLNLYYKHGGGKNDR